MSVYYDDSEPVYWHFLCGKYHEEDRCPLCEFCGSQLRDLDGACPSYECRLEQELRNSETRNNSSRESEGNPRK